MEYQTNNLENQNIEIKEEPPVVLKWKFPLILMLIIGFTALTIAYIFLR